MLNAEQIEELIKKFEWGFLHNMYGHAHSSIIGFISTQWISLDPNVNSLFDGVPSTVIGKGRIGQKNSDILLCREDKPYMPVEVETLVEKYEDKLGTLFDYIDNKPVFDGIEFGLFFMTNRCTGPTKYKHNWDRIKKEVINRKKYSIALVSIVKCKSELSNTCLDSLRKRNDYSSYEITSIDYWIHDKNGKIKEGRLWSK